MAQQPSTPQPGGFFPQTGLPSPAPSSASSRAASSLPHPRRRALAPGGNKEDLVRRYADERLLNVSRRYVKKFGSNDGNDSIVGFNSASELCRELDALADVLWLSGTRE